MMKHLFDRTGKWIDMCNWYSDVVSNASIRNNNNKGGIRWDIEDKFAAIGSFALLVVVISFVKWKMTRENIN